MARTKQFIHVYTTANRFIWRSEKNWEVESELNRGIQCAKMCSQTKSACLQSINTYGKALSMTSQLIRDLALYPTDHISLRRTSNRNYSEKQVNQQFISA